MKQIERVSDDKNLADILNVPKSTLSNWKNRNALPIEVIFQFSAKNNLDLNWLLLGERKEELDAAERLALAAFRALDDSKKLEAIGFLSGLDKSAVGGKNIFNDNSSVGVMADSITKPIKQYFGKKEK
ncbi:helix-turn-helix domain-containing protein [Testudinibacter sp. P27/CKL/0425]